MRVEVRQVKTRVGVCGAGRGDASVVTAVASSGAGCGRRSVGAGKSAGKAGEEREERAWRSRCVAVEQSGGGKRHGAAANRQRHGGSSIWKKERARETDRSGPRAG